MRGAAAFAATAFAAAFACAAWAGGTPVQHAAATGPRTSSASSKRGAAPRATPRTFDFDRDIGLVEGDRKDSLWLMIADSTLGAGDSLTLVSDEPDPDPNTYVTIVAAAVKERLERMPPALYGKMVPEPGDVFYRLAAPPGALDCCIFGYAVRAPRGTIRPVSGRAEADLDRDGVPECFQSCGSGDYLRPSVWSGRPIEGVRRWSRAYRLGFDVETNCPGSQDSLSAKPSSP